MLRNHVCSLIILLIAAPVALAQGTFKPRDADEEHAWRLYNQYKESKKKEVQLRAGIDQTKGDIKTVNVGSVPGLGIDPADIARLAKLREALAAEKEQQQELEDAWDRKFSGRYGELKESESTIYDPKTKQKMDKIRFRLMAFPFNVKGAASNGSGVTATLEGVPDETPRGSKRNITVNVEGLDGAPGKIIWHTERGVTFLPATSTGDTTIAKFDWLGPVTIWAEVMVVKDGAYKTVARTEESTVLVTVPKPAASSEPLVAARTANSGLEGGWDIVVDGGPNRFLSGPRGWILICRSGTNFIGSRTMDKNDRSPQWLGSFSSDGATVSWNETSWGQYVWQARFDGSELSGSVTLTFAADKSEYTGKWTAKRWTRPNPCGR